MTKLLIVIITIVILSSALAAGAIAAQLRIAGEPIEVVLSEVAGGRTVRIELMPLDAEGEPKPAPDSSVLLPITTTEKLRVKELGERRHVRVGPFNVYVAPQPLTISILRPGGRIVQELVVKEDDGSIVFRTEGLVFGLGEGRQQFDRRGFFYNFVNGQTTFLRTHSATIPVPLLIGTDGWMLFIHNPPPPSDDPREANRPWGQFDLRGEDAGPPPATDASSASLLERPPVAPGRGRFIPRRQTLNQAPTQIFVSALDTPADAFEEFSRLVGRPAMPPKWALGYMQSHRSLAGPHEPIEVAQKFREKELPCDALIYLGTGYTNGQTGWNMGHGSLEFNPNTFDKPQEMLDKLHALNFKVVLHKNAAPPRLHGKSVNDASADPFHISNYWAKHVPLVKMSVDGWWPDDGDNLPIEARLARHRLYYEGSLRDRPNVRPWTLNRNGYAGSARYGAWIWSGDVESRWITLANHVPVGLNFAMSVSPFWGSDTGGFFLARPNEYTGELYVRWFQFSTFNPLFRSHGRNWHLHLPWGWNTGQIGPRESGERAEYPPESELRNADVEPICKRFLELRYRLLPYNYTIARQACDTGMPMMRALWLHYPDDPEAVTIGDEYLWGRDFLVAPVVEKDAKTRRVYLPKGDWFDWWSGEKLAGGRWVDRPVDLAMMPLFVRAGAIVPLDPVRQYTAETVSGPTTVRLYSGADGEFVLYDDDGTSMGYRDGTDRRMSWIRFTWNQNARRITIRLDDRSKQWSAGSLRVFELQKIGPDNDQRTTRVEFGGEPVELPL
jgi:alpha-glucosidase/alpha-D-xyloside xylohydrolase